MLPQLLHFLGQGAYTPHLHVAIGCFVSSLFLKLRCAGKYYYLAHMKHLVISGRGSWHVKRKMVPGTGTPWEETGFGFAAILMYKYSKDTLRIISYIETYQHLFERRDGVDLAYCPWSNVFSNIFHLFRDVRLQSLRRP